MVITMPKKNYYTIYLKATDEIVCSGTSEECAKALNKSINCFYSLISKNRLHKHKKYAIYSEPIDMTEDETIDD